MEKNLIKNIEKIYFPVIIIIIFVSPLNDVSSLPESNKEDNSEKIIPKENNLPQKRITRLKDSPLNKRRPWGD
jgi:hypothetical protein